MIITLSGTPGSGKSTIAKILAQKLNCERVYAGGIFRQWAKEKNMTVEEFNIYVKSHPEIDQKLDTSVAALAREMTFKGKDVIAEGRPLYHFLPESIKIFITVDSKEGARRILKDLNNKATKEARNQQEASSLEEMEKLNIERENQEDKRYKKVYHINFRDPSNFDLIIDTTKITAEQVAEKILKFIKKP